MSILGYVYRVNSLNQWYVDLYLDPEDHEHYSHTLGVAIYSYTDINLCTRAAVVHTRRYYTCNVRLENYKNIKKLKHAILANEGWLRFEILKLHTSGLEVRAYDRFTETSF